MIKKLKEIWRDLREYWYAKQIQYPPMDDETLYQFYDWLQTEIAVRRARHQSTKQQTEMLHRITAEIVIRQKEAKNEHL